MLTGERRIKLLEAIENKQFISVAQLSEIFQVHETTIRRDLDELESQGLVVRIHGGVVPASIKQDEPDLKIGQLKICWKKQKSENMRQII